MPPATSRARLLLAALVGVNDGIVVGGFLVGGMPGLRLLIRGGGPSLAADGLTGLLADPLLEVRTGDGGIVSANDNWHDTQAMAIAATGRAPTDDLEAAALVDVTAGPYTVTVHGAGSTTGLGFVDLFHVP